MFLCGQESTPAFPLHWKDTDTVDSVSLALGLNRIFRDYATGQSEVKRIRDCRMLSLKQGVSINPTCQDSETIVKEGEERL